MQSCCCHTWHSRHDNLWLPEDLWLAHCKLFKWVSRKHFTAYEQSKVLCVAPCRRVQQSSVESHIWHWHSVSCLVSVISSLLDTLLAACSSPLSVSTCHVSHLTTSHLQLCLAVLGVLGDANLQQNFPSKVKTTQKKSFFDKSLLLLQFPYFEFFLPQRRSFIFQRAKSPKISSHPNMNLNRQFDGYPDWQKDS